MAPPVGSWPTDAVACAATLVLGAWQAGGSGAGSSPGRLGIVAALALAVGLSRRSPPAALLLLWSAGVAQVATAQDVLAADLAAVPVAYACARYGTRGVLWVSGLSVPVGAAIATWHVLVNGSAVYGAYSRLDLPTPDAGSTATAVPAGLIALLVLAAPWAAGLVVRLRSQARRDRLRTQRAEDERESAVALAAVQADRAGLARDVHDVVGHSLTVILAQAEAAQYLPDDDTARIRQSLDNVAASARQSLKDVRAVLATTGDRGERPDAVDELAALLDGLRTGGTTVRSTVLGEPRPLAADLQSVAYRVLQEMLTNSLRHGRRGGPIDVEQRWDSALRIQVSNGVEAGRSADLAALPAGRRAPLGLAGMRRRLEGVGGHLDVDELDGPVGPVHRTTAWLPLPRVEPIP